MYKKNVLYLSLTGMTEPLGRSQVLEYLIDLSKENNIQLISFERKNDLENIDQIKLLVDKHHIKWTYLLYSNKYGVFSSVWQILQAIRLGSKIIKTHSIDIVHARSMIPATMGLVLKKVYGVKLLFDIRGFAIDEKVDSGRLPAGSLLYKVLKKLDKLLYLQADHIVTLTQTAKDILHNKFLIPAEKITVIPTCASKDIFYAISNAEKQAFKNSLGYQTQDKVILHTGTVGGWYDFDAEVKLVKALMEIDESIHFLVLNKNAQQFIQDKLSYYHLPKQRVKVLSVLFEEMHQYLNIASCSLFFIMPSYSKKASIPTKFAENIACYLPSITNTGVGDMAFYMQQYDVGYLLELDELKNHREETARAILSFLNNNQDVDVHVYDELFDCYFDKAIAVSKYQGIYEQL